MRGEFVRPENAGFRGCQCCMPCVKEGWMTVFPKAEIFDFEISKNESIHSLYVEFLLFKAKV